MALEPVAGEILRHAPANDGDQQKSCGEAKPYTDPVGWGGADGGPDVEKGVAAGVQDQQAHHAEVPPTVPGKDGAAHGDGQQKRHREIKERHGQGRGDPVPKHGNARCEPEDEKHRGEGAAQGRLFGPTGRGGKQEPGHRGGETAEEQRMGVPGHRVGKDRGDVEVHKPQTHGHDRPNARTEEERAEAC